MKRKGIFTQGGFCMKRKVERGGKREGVGRKPIYSEGRMIQVTVQLPVSLFEKIPSPKSEFIRKLIEKSEVN
jgi:hypothetical protein